jgi:ribosomal peptide maturation radical SAM protein 1
MRTLSLINMPFSNLLMPSIALTQIKSVVDAQFGDQLSTEIIYLNHDFARYMGLELYDFISDSMDSLNTGLGDWLFRQIAFPELPDNSDRYWGRYFPHQNTQTTRLKAEIARLRPGLETLCDELITNSHCGNSDIVGFTTMFMQNVACFAMAQKLKRRRPSMTIVLGGANCEFPMGRVICERIDAIDFVFSGPALKSFPEFLRLWLRGDHEQCHSIRGVFRRGVSTPVAGPATIGEDLNIDSPISLDYEPFIERLQSYFPDLKAKPVLPLETSRGCWWGERAHCTFCGLNGASMAYRAMKPEMAIHLFSDLFKYSGRVSRLIVVDNILPKSYLQQVLPFLATPKDMEIFYEVKADLTEQDMAALAKARVTHIQPGVEALATSTLKLMKKGTTAFQNLQLLKLCVMYGVSPHWNLLVGFPGEGEDSYGSYVEILPLLAHLHPPSGAYPVRFDRFSPYFNQATAYALDLRPLDCYKLTYPLEDKDLHDLAYYFADHNLGQYFTTMMKWIGRVRSKVADWQARWSEAQGGERPRLCFVGDSRIYDSRSSEVIEHRISATGRSILKYLAGPVRRDMLMKSFAPADEASLTKELRVLQDMNLLFQENDRLLSLVIDDDEDVRQRVEHSVASLPQRQQVLDLVPLVVAQPEMIRPM